jgi:uncharacterized YigZ family protein
MDDDEFLTIETPGAAQIRVMASRFLGSAFSIGSLDDFERAREETQKKCFDATHWCWALRLGNGTALVERSSDAGEPHGTAGTPILREIQSRDLTDCAVIVTRYFGGTKLGTGNLARAYAECAAAALAAAAQIRRTIYDVLRVDGPFGDQGVVYHVAERFAAIVEPLDAPDQASFIVKVRHRSLEVLRQRLIDESAGRISAREAGQWTA